MIPKTNEMASQRAVGGLVANRSRIMPTAKPRAAGAKGAYSRVARGDSAGSGMSKKAPSKTRRDGASVEEPERITTGGEKTEAAAWEWGVPGQFGDPREEKTARLVRRPCFEGSSQA